MARKQQKITFEIYLDGERVEKIPPEAKAGMMKRMGEAMSLYYTQHPEEYELLLKGGESCERARGDQIFGAQAGAVGTEIRSTASP